MPQLLVSVRNREEAIVVTKTDVAIIDIKNPNAGSLGRADVSTVDSILDIVPDNLPVSLALGELVDHPEPIPIHQSSRLRFAKVGLSGLGENSGWRDLWLNFISTLKPSIEVVAVAYADWNVAHSPKPIDVLNHAAKANCKWFLMDTFSKQGNNLLANCGVQELATIIDEAHKRGLKIAIAGSLGRREIQELISYGPDIFAVRGAACESDRTSMIDFHKTKELAALVGGNTH